MVNEPMVSDALPEAICIVQHEFGTAVVSPKAVLNVVHSVDVDGR